MADVSVSVGLEGVPQAVSEADRLRQALAELANLGAGVSGGSGGGFGAGTTAMTALGGGSGLAAVGAGGTLPAAPLSTPGAGASSPHLPPSAIAASVANPAAHGTPGTPMFGYSQMYGPVITGPATTVPVTPGGGPAMAPGSGFNTHGGIGSGAYGPTPPIPGAGWKQAFSGMLQGGGGNYVDGLLGAYRNAEGFMQYGGNGSLIGRAAQMAETAGGSGFVGGLISKIPGGAAGLGIGLGVAGAVIAGGKMVIDMTNDRRTQDYIATQPSYNLGTSFRASDLRGEGDDYRIRDAQRRAAELQGDLASHDNHYSTTWGKMTDWFGIGKNKWMTGEERRRREREIEEVEASGVQSVMRDRYRLATNQRPSLDDPYLQSRLQLGMSAGLQSGEWLGNVQYRSALWHGVDAHSLNSGYSTLLAMSRQQGMGNLYSAIQNGQMPKGAGLEPLIQMAVAQGDSDGAIALLAKLKADGGGGYGDAYRRAQATDAQFTGLRNNVYAGSNRDEAMRLSASWNDLMGGSQFTSNAIRAQAKDELTETMKLLTAQMAKATSPDQRAQIGNQIEGVRQRIEGMAQEQIRANYGVLGQQYQTAGRGLQTDLQTGLFGGMTAGQQAGTYSGIAGNLGNRADLLQRQLNDSRIHFNPEQRAAMEQEIRSLRFQQTVGIGRDMFGRQVGEAYSDIGLMNATEGGASAYAGLYGGPGDIRSAAMGRNHSLRSQMQVQQAILADPYRTYGERQEARAALVSLQTNIGTNTESANRSYFAGMTGLAGMDMSAAGIHVSDAFARGEGALGASGLMDASRQSMVQSMAARERQIEAMQSGILRAGGDPRQHAGLRSLQLQQQEAESSMVSAGNARAYGPLSSEMRDRFAQTDFDISRMNRLPFMPGNMRGMYGAMMREGQELRGVVAAEREAEMKRQGFITDEQNRIFNTRDREAISRYDEGLLGMSFGWQNRFASEMMNTPGSFAFTQSGTAFRSIVGLQGTFNPRFGMSARQMNKDLPDLMRQMMVGDYSGADSGAGRRLGAVSGGGFGGHGGEMPVPVMPAARGGSGGSGAVIQVNSNNQDVVAAINNLINVVRGAGGMMPGGPAQAYGTTPTTFQNSNSTSTNNAMSRGRGQGGNRGATS